MLAAVVGQTASKGGRGGRPPTHNNSMGQEEGEEVEQEAPLLQHPAAAVTEDPHPRPPAARSSFYGTLELYEDDAAMLDDGGCPCMHV